MQNSKDEQYRQARHKITRMLARREHSQKEILQKLTASGIEVEIAKETLQQFTDKDLQSNDKYLYSLVRRYASKGKGPVLIHYKAEQQGIEGFDINAIAETLEIDWFALAEQVRVKRFGAEKPIDWNIVQKQKRFLQTRGFSNSQIEHAVK